MSAAGREERKGDKGGLMQSTAPWELSGFPVVTLGLLQRESFSIFV